MFNTTNTTKHTSHLYPTMDLTMDLPHCTAQVPNTSHLYQDYEHKQKERAHMQQLSAKPVTMVQLKRPSHSPRSSRQHLHIRSLDSTFHADSGSAGDICWAPPR
jgi:hypothetical protein